MFGYVKALVPELRVKEHELYKSVYCGLCHHLKKRSLFMTFSLSYDFVLPSLFALSFTDKKSISVKQKRCLAHPFKKRNFIDGGDAMQAVADSAILLIYYKLLDDRLDRDGGFWKRISTSVMLAFASSARKKVLKSGDTNTDIDGIIKENIAELSVLEKKKSESVYDCADTFGKLLAEVFSLFAPTESDRRCMHELGYRVGRWIYIADALDDIEKDRKKGAYNPFVLSGVDTSSKEFKENVSLSLRLELAEGEKALDLIEISDGGLRELIYNILFLGMPNVIESILKREENKKLKGKKN